LVGATTFSEAVKLFNCKNILGLSGTPRRKDGMEAAFILGIGEIISGSQKVVVEPKIRFVEYAETRNAEQFVWGDKLNLGRYYNFLAKSSTLNSVLLRVLVSLIKKDKNVLLLTERLSQITFLKKELMSLGHIQVGEFTGSLKELDKKVLLGTYGSAGLGADLPRLDCLVLAMPRTDIEQAVGRILRRSKVGSEDAPLVVDVCDTTSSMMNKWREKRHRFYRTITKDIGVINARRDSA
jgi:superfamily II DNA or RNA helicase